MQATAQEIQKRDNFLSELLYIRFALRHIESRLRQLKPGKNTNFNIYNKLIDERMYLTERLKAAILCFRKSNLYVDSKTSEPSPFFAMLQLEQSSKLRISLPSKSYRSLSKIPSA
jgi:hypothetical protein